MPLQNSLPVALLFISSAVIAQDMEQIDRLWKARGLQALEKVEKLTKTKNPKFTTEQSCELALEAAYMAHANPQTIDIVRKPGGPGITNHILIFMRESGKEVAAQLAYMYQEKTGTLIGVKVSQIHPDSATLTMLNGTSGLIGLRVHKCSFALLQNDPFVAQSAAFQ